MITPKHQERSTTTTMTRRWRPELRTRLAVLVVCFELVPVWAAAQTSSPGADESSVEERDERWIRLDREERQEIRRARQLARKMRLANLELRLDPVVDPVVIAIAATVAITSDIVFASGQIAPREPGDPDAVRPIDRRRANSDRIAGGPERFEVSDIAVLMTGFIAAVDVAARVFHGAREQRRSGGRHLVLYLETAFVATALTNVFKVAFLRPRPSAYIEMRATGVPPTDTGESLSFFSGHSALAASLTATAIYLSFQSETPRVVRWLLGLGGAALTASVAIRRVTEAHHFPTDVITGVVVGAAVGVLVPHLHLRERQTVALVPSVARDSAGVSVLGMW